MRYKEGYHELIRLVNSAFYQLVCQATYFVHDYINMTVEFEQINNQTNQIFIGFDQSELQIFSDNFQIQFEILCIYNQNPAQKIFLHSRLGSRMQQCVKVHRNRSARRVRSQHRSRSHSQFKSSLNAQYFLLMFNYGVNGNEKQQQTKSTSWCDSKLYILLIAFDSSNSNIQMRIA